MRLFLKVQQMKLSKMTAKKFFLGMALALAPFMANSENTIKLILKEKITFVKQDNDADKQKSGTALR